MLGIATSASAQDLEAMLQPRAMGSADAPVTITEYASMTCPHCAAFHQETLPELKRQYIDTGKVRLVFVDFPFDELALRAAMLARCAPPDQYFAYVDTLFANQASWASAAEPLRALRQIALLGGMSGEAFDQCMSNEALVDGILRLRLQGQQQYGIDSTPTFVINGEKAFSGAQPLEAFERRLKPLLGGS